MNTKQPPSDFEHRKNGPEKVKVILWVCNFCYWTGLEQNLDISKKSTIDDFIYACPRCKQDKFLMEEW